MERETPKLHVHYFVKPSFEEHYSDKASIRKVEDVVEEQWIYEMQQECFYERQKYVRLEKAYHYYKDRKTKSELDNFKMPACTELQHLGIKPKRPSLWGI